MTSDSADRESVIDVESVLTAALKLLGIYLLYNSIYGSTRLLAVLSWTKSTFANNSQFSASELMQIFVASFGILLSVGFAIVLIQHGERAAHWLSIRGNLQARVSRPTAKWYPFSILLIGVWVFVAQFFPSLASLSWAIGLAFTRPNSSFMGYGTANVVHSAVYAAVTLAIGLGLIFAARPLGDWLYRISGADRDAEIEVETH